MIQKIFMGHTRGLQPKDMAWRHCFKKQEGGTM